MLEHWTIDAVADEIEAQFKGADPTKKLLRRFYKEGRRFGRNGTSPEPMRNLLVNAVEIATSKLAEEYLTEEHAAEATLVGVRARKKMLDDDDPDDDDAGDTKYTEKSDSSEGGDTSSSGLARGSAGPDLKAALGALRARRLEEAARTRASEAEAARAQRKQALQSADEQIAVIENQLEDLPEKYHQLIESCHETGELLWSRFCTGYVKGAGGRGGPDDDEEGPDPEIEFEYPDALEPEGEDGATPSESGALTRDTASTTSADKEG
jgi:hypothetical protein